MHICSSQEQGAQIAWSSEKPGVSDLIISQVLSLLAIQFTEWTDVLHGNIRQVQLGEIHETSEWTDVLHLRIRKLNLLTSLQI